MCLYRLLGRENLTDSQIVYSIFWMTSHMIPTFLGLVTIALQTKHTSRCWSSQMLRPLTMTTQMREVRTRSQSSLRMSMTCLEPLEPWNHRPLLCYNQPSKHLFYVMYIYNIFLLSSDKIIDFVIFYIKL